MSSPHTFVIPTISNNGDDASVFSTRTIGLEGDVSRMLSQQISAENFRLRKSAVGYQSNWHVAGDPTLLVLLSGAIRITLHNAMFKDFFAGDMFIAEDYLKQGMIFDDKKHGHRAEVIGAEPVSVLHLKLEKR